MAYTECFRSVTLPAGEDLTSAYAHCVTIDGNGRIVQTDAATEHIVGVIIEKPSQSAVGTAVPVAMIGAGGVVKMRAASSITAGQLIVPSTTDGRVAGVANIGALAADQMAAGVALESASSGDIFSVLAQVVVAPHTA